MVNDWYGKDYVENSWALNFGVSIRWVHTLLILRVLLPR